MSEVVTWPSSLRSAVQLDKQPKSPRSRRASETVMLPSPSRSGGQSLGSSGPPPLHSPEMDQVASNCAPDEEAKPLNKNTDHVPSPERPLPNKSTEAEYVPDDEDCQEAGHRL